jgi:hypothetical protein
VEHVDRAHRAGEGGVLHDIEVSVGNLVVEDLRRRGPVEPEGGGSDASAVASAGAQRRVDSHDGLRRHDAAPNMTGNVSNISRAMSGYCVAR